MVFNFSIARGIGYKKSELCDLSDGSTLVVGSKEVEVSMGMYVRMCVRMCSRSACIMCMLVFCVSYTEQDYQPLRFPQTRISISGSSCHQTSLFSYITADSALCLIALTRTENS